MAAAPAAAAVAAGREKAEGGGDIPSPPLPPPPRGQRADDSFDEMTRKELCTDTFCKVCGAVLQFESQRIAHYEGKRHAQKVRLYLQMHSGQKERRHVNFQEDPNVDKNTYCRLCNMIFTSPVVAQSHYLGKIHAKKLKQQSDQAQPTQDVQSEPDTSAIPVLPETSVEKNLSQDVDFEDPSSSSRTALDLDDPDKYCKLCSAPFNNPLMAHQHYVGKKHKRNEVRKRLMAEIGSEAIPVESKANVLGVGNYICPICSISLTSIEMYQSHMQGNKHQAKESMIVFLMKNSKKTYSSFQDELADYIKVQKARGLEPKTHFRKPEEKERLEFMNGLEETFTSDQGLFSRDVCEPDRHSSFFSKMYTFSYAVENRFPHQSSVLRDTFKLGNVSKALHSPDCSEKQVSQLAAYRDGSCNSPLPDSSDGYKPLSSRNSSSSEKRSRKLPKAPRTKKERSQGGEGTSSQHLLTVKRKQCNEETDWGQYGEEKKKVDTDIAAESKSKRSKVKGCKDGSLEKESRKHKKKQKKCEAGGATEEEMLWNESVLGF